MRIRFLGTGAGDWEKPEPNGAYRRHASAIFDEALLIDLTAGAVDLLGEARPRALLHTHSHPDHYDPLAIAKAAPGAVYAHESWAAEIDAPGAAATPVALGAPFEAAGFRVTALEANHSTARPRETCVHYLLQKRGERALYATDGAWMLNQTMHHLLGAQLDALIVDATIGDGHAGDGRIFEHNSLDMVRHMVPSLIALNILKPAAPVLLTHLARTLHPAQQDLQRALPPGWIACFDGLIVDL